MNVQFPITKITGGVCTPTNGGAITPPPIGQINRWEGPWVSFSVGPDTLTPNGSIILNGSRPTIMGGDGFYYDRSFKIGKWERSGDDIVFTFNFCLYNTNPDTGICECSISFFPPNFNCDPNEYVYVSTPNLNAPYSPPLPPNQCAPNVIN
jgi:hypothetical protein